MSRLQFSVYAACADKDGQVMGYNLSSIRTPLFWIRKEDLAMFLQMGKVYLTNVSFDSSGGIVLDRSIPIQPLTGVFFHPRSYLYTLYRQENDFLSTRNLMRHPFGY